MARGHGQRGGAAFKRGDALFEHGLGRVHDAGVDVAEGLEAEQRGCVIGIIEDEAGGLVDRRGARASGRIGLRAGMNGKRVETWLIVRHGPLPLCPVGPVAARVGCRGVYPASPGAGQRRILRATSQRHACRVISASFREKHAARAAVRERMGGEPARSNPPRHGLASQLSAAGAAAHSGRRESSQSREGRTCSGRSCSTSSTTSADTALTSQP
jgi:hypothetical protein